MSTWCTTIFAQPMQSTLLLKIYVCKLCNPQKCRRCGLIKAASEFYKNRLMLDGLYSHCKTCYQASAAARSAARSPVDAKACRRCVAAHCPELPIVHERESNA